MQVREYQCTILSILHQNNTIRYGLVLGYIALISKCRCGRGSIPRDGIFASLTRLDHAVVVHVAVESWCVKDFFFPLLHHAN